MALTAATISHSKRLFRAPLPFDHQHIAPMGG